MNERGTARGRWRRAAWGLAASGAIGVAVWLAAWGERHDAGVTAVAVPAPPAVSAPGEGEAPRAAVPEVAKDNAGAGEKRPRTLMEQLFFKGRKEARYTWDAVAYGAEDCWIESPDGVRIHAWYFRARRPRAVVLFAHGNGGNVTYWAEWAGYLSQRMRASVLLFDYRGYGRSEGEATLEGVLLDARAARDYLARREGVAAEDLVLLGHSLGGGIAVELATTDGARGLILERTFPSLRDVARVHHSSTLVDILVPDRLNSARTIAQYHGPVLQSHGDADTLIPIALAESLFDAANEPKRFVVLRGVGHNGAHPQNYVWALDRFFAELP